MNALKKIFLKIKTSSPKQKTIAVLLFLIILAGAYLRLSDFHNLARFNADQVRDAKIVDAMFEQNEFPLLGPKAGGTTFKLGPAFYYLEYFSGLLFGNNPAGIAVFIPILSLISILLFFLFLRYYFPPWISLLATFLYAISFYAVRYSRFAWNPNVIPFFLLAFLLLILAVMKSETKKKMILYILLGLVIGIGIQLHTTLLILLPVIFIGAHIFKYFKERKIQLSYLLLTVMIAIFLYSPAIIYDLKNEGKNIRSFLAGASVKTEKNSSFFENTILDAEFLLQGNTYALSGIEPQKKWTGIEKLVESKNPKEISLFVFGTGFFIFGLWLFLTNLKKEKDEQKKHFLWLTFLVTALSFLLFLPIANELNLRFFIILIFVPFIFFGLILDFLSKIINNRFIRIALFAVAIVFLIALNIRSFNQTYDLENYKLPDSAYGGISLGETEKISCFISDTSKNNSVENEKLFIFPFEFERSLKFINQKSGLNPKNFSNKVAADGSIVFLISEKTNAAETLEKQDSSLIPIDSTDIGRFTIVALRFELPVKIGFITDLHAKRGGAKKNFILNFETNLMLEDFINHMNKEFQPDFVVQGGDLIEGTRRRGEKSINDFKYITANYFKKLSVPFYGVIGNHEMRGFSKEEWAGLIGQTKTYYYYDHLGTRTIFLDGDDNQDGEDETGLNAYYMSENQFQWLDEILSDKTVSRKIIFIHYPVVSQKFNPGDIMIEPNQALRLKQMFSENHVTAVFSGHVERLEMNTEDGVDYFIIPGLERSKNKDVLWLNTFADITIGRKAEVKLYYKKSSDEKDYRELEIPSKEFDRIEK